MVLPHWYFHAIGVLVLGRCCSGLTLPGFRRQEPEQLLRSFAALSVKGVAAHRWAHDDAEATSIMRPLARAFDELAAAHPDALAPELAPPPSGTRLSAGADHGFHCYAAGTTRAMRWLYAADGATLDLFRPLAARCAARMEASVFAAGWEPPHAAPAVELTAASFVAIVGAREGISDDIARWHEDWGPCDRHEAFSVLLPARAVPAAAKRAYRLQYRTWDDLDAVREYQYAFGDAIVVDGQAPHRTSPFHARDLAGAGGERVLVCLNFASTDPAARDAQRATMDSQTPNFYHLPED